MMNESMMMHGQDYNHQDVAGWLMSEKLDGCRAFWDGATMWTRGGKVIDIPQAMRDALPARCLDGEIHAGRGGFEIARQFVQYGRWNDRVEFSAFDVPAFPGCFVVRRGWLENNLPVSGIVNCVRHDVCLSIDAAVSFMRDVQVDGGEGVVLRSPYNVYLPGRTSDVLKLKYWGPECSR